MYATPTAPPSLDDSDSMTAVWSQFLFPLLGTILLMLLVLGLWGGACYLIDRLTRNKKTRQWEDVVNPRVKRW